jgi:hypothetical protein
VKKIFSILLLFLFLFNTLGYYFVFKVNQSIIQSEIRGMISSGLLNVKYTLVTVDHPESNPQFKMMDHNEFTYCGQLYDIVSASVKGNTTWFYCYNDKQEERLISGFERIQNLDPGCGSSHKTKHTTALIYHLITMALIKDPIMVDYPQPLKVTFGYTQDHPFPAFQIPLSPPPKLS